LRGLRPDPRPTRRPGETPPRNAGQGGVASSPAEVPRRLSALLARMGMPESEGEDPGTTTQAATAPRRQRGVGSDEGAGGKTTSIASGSRSPRPSPRRALPATGGGGRPAEDQPARGRGEALPNFPDAGEEPPLTAESNSELNSNGEAAPDSKQGPRTPATGRKTTARGRLQPPAADPREKGTRRNAALFPSPPPPNSGSKTTARGSPQPSAEDQHEKGPRRDAARLSGSPTAAEGAEEETARERDLRLQVAMLTRERDAARRAARGNPQPQATG